MKTAAFFGVRGRTGRRLAKDSLRVAAKSWGRIHEAAKTDGVGLNKQ